MIVNRDDIIKMLPKALNREESEFTQITDGSDLREHGLDSISSIELIVMLEDHYNISVDDDDLLIDNFNTVEKLVKLMEKYVNA
jgi:acyl carrier protein